MMIQKRQAAYAPAREAGPQRERRAVPERVWRLLALLALLALWRAAVALGDYPPFILPAPELVAARWFRELAGGELLRHAGYTLAEALGGFSLALLAGGLLGYLLAQAPRLERIVAPQIALVQAIPVVAVAPLIILWLGVTLQAKILVAALVTFFPILSSVIVALRGVPREVREEAMISGASRWELLRHVELPLALPGIFGGIKTSLALATTGAVVAEFIGGRDGLGALITIARGMFDTPLLFAALLTLALITLCLYLAAMLLERRLVDWES